MKGIRWWSESEIHVGKNCGENRALENDTRVERDQQTRKTKVQGRDGKYSLNQWTFSSIVLLSMVVWSGTRRRRRRCQQIEINALDSSREFQIVLNENSSSVHWPFFMRLSFSSSGLDYDICRYSRAKTVLERRRRRKKEKNLPYVCAPQKSLGMTKESSSSPSRTRELTSTEYKDTVKRAW